MKYEIGNGVLMLIVGVVVLLLSGGKIFSLFSNPIMIILVIIAIFALRKN